jgi:hypothetical protein
MALDGSNVVTGPNRNTGNTLNELFSKNYMSIIIKIIIIYGLWDKINRGTGSSNYARHP